MEQIALSHQSQSKTQASPNKRRVTAPVMVLLLTSILSSQLEAQLHPNHNRKHYQPIKANNTLAAQHMLLKVEQDKMRRVIENLSGLSAKQKKSLVALYITSQTKLNQLQGSMLNLNQKQSTMMPGHYQYQSQMEDIFALKASLAKEHKQLKSHFKRELIQLLTPKQRQQLQSAIQQKQANAKGIDKSWM